MENFTCSDIETGPTVEKAISARTDFTTILQSPLTALMKPKNNHYHYMIQLTNTLVMIVNIDVS